MYLCITKKILIGNGFKVKIRVGYGLFKVKRLFFQMDTYIWHVLFAWLVAAVLCIGTLVVTVRNGHL